MSADNWTICPQVEKHTNTGTRSTLREDWHLGIVRGEFHVDYIASCRECGYSFMFKTTQAALVVKS